MSVQLTTMEGKQRKKFTARQRLNILTEWDSSHDSVSLEEAIGAGGRGVSQGNPIQSEPTSQRVTERESKSRGHCDLAIAGTDAFEKR